ncbi:MAG: CAP domain-containing protein [Flavobacteriaceae bacterium]|nr:CAP domain-containing protein [Flavobacteriaceae bacterium]
MRILIFNLLVITASSIFLLSCNKNDDSIDPVAIEEIHFNSLESEILYLVNSHRESIGLNKVSGLNHPYTEATNHTNYMINKGIISHDNFEFRKANLMIKSSAKIILENVAMGYPTAESTMTSWLNSSNHRLVIENPYVQYMGISAQKDAQGRNYYTQIFIGK